MSAESKSPKKLKKIIIPAVIILVFAAVTAVIVFFITNKEKSYRLIKVKSFDGGVTIERDGEDTDAFNGLQLISDDMVEVSENSFLELLADEDKHIGAEENTGFVLHASGTSKSGNITIELLYGKALFTIDEKLSEDSSFKVKTPNATLSVRGTKFSVEYNKETGETTVEVFEGKVWASYNGTEEILEKGDKRVIGTELNEPAIPIDDNSQIDNSSDDSSGSDVTETKYSAVLQIERTFSNVPEYATADPDYLGMTYLEVYGGRNGDSANISLEKYAQNVEEAYIKPLLPRSLEYFESIKQTLIYRGVDELENSPVDISEWLEGIDAPELVLVDRSGDYYKFKPTDVAIQWIVTQSETNAQGQYETYYPMGYGGDVGASHRISGMKYIFYGDAYLAGDEEGETPADTPETPEQPDASDMIFTRLYQNTPDYLNAAPELLQLETIDHVDDIDATVYSSDIDSNNINSLRPIEQSIIAINKKFVEPVMDRANALFEEKKQEVIDNLINNEVAEEIDVTDWFADFQDREIVVDNGTSYYYFDFTKVYFNWIISNSQVTSPGEYETYYPMGYDGQNGKPYRIVGFSLTFYRSTQPN